MSFFPAFARPLARVPALLGDGLGNVRVPGWDQVLVRMDDGTGLVVPATLAYAVTSTAGTLDDLYLPAEGTPVTLIYDDRATLPRIDADLLP